MKFTSVMATAAMMVAISGTAHGATVVAGNYPGAADSPYQGYWVNESGGQNFLVGFSLAQATQISGLRILMGNGYGNVGDSVQIKIRAASGGAPAAVNLYSFADTIDTSVSYANANAVTSNFAAISLAAGNYYIGMSSNIGSGVWASYGPSTTNDQWQLSGDNLGFQPDIRDLAFQVIGDAGAVPEPAAWALMLGGFGLAGTAMRRRRKAISVTYA